jgi:hypothetical protein
MRKKKIRSIVQGSWCRELRRACLTNRFGRRDKRGTAAHLVDDDNEATATRRQLARCLRSR